MTHCGGFPEIKLIVTAQMVESYGQANGDRNWLHYEAEAARAAGFAKPIAHGALSAAILMRACRDYFGASWLEGGRLSLRFMRPLFVGDTITTGGKSLKRTNVDGAVRETFEVWCLDGAGQRVISGEATGERLGVPVA